MLQRWAKFGKFSEDSSIRIVPVRNYEILSAFVKVTPRIL